MPIDGGTGVEAESGRAPTDLPRRDERQRPVRPRSPSEALEPDRAPEPPERKDRQRPHPILTVLNGMMTLLVIILLGIGGLFYFAKQQFDRPGPLQTSTVVVIPKGQGVNAIAAHLEREGIITDRRIFVASVIYFKAQDKLKAGEYEIPKQASMRAVLDRLVEGKAILHKITIPEGFTSMQVVDRLSEEPLLTGTLTAIPAEGSLLPETYKYTRGTTRQEMIERMQVAMRKYVTKLWQTRDPDLPFATPKEAIVLASIVEKETSRPDERTRIAGVFINRLKRNMRLQSDPTIIYGLTGGRGPLGRPILKSELERPTPYNTYLIDGLPPTPIANPGRASIEAVLNPASTKDLYFVADGTGGHAFTASLDEHNRNVARWREIEREIRAREARGQQESPAGEQAPAADDVPAPLRGLAVSGNPDQAAQAADANAAARQEPVSDVDATPDPAAGNVPLPVRKPQP